MAQHVGIVGCSAEGAALCYRTLCLEGEPVFGPHGHPEVSLHSHPLGAYMEHIHRHDWAAVGELMLDSAGKLARAGADFLICPDNTIHEALPAILARSPLPWLSIAEVVTEEAARRAYRRLGITGTRFLVASEVYPRALDKRHLQYQRPTAEECTEVDRIIMEELVRGVFAPAAVAYLQSVIRRMAEGGCDAVVLGCTEIPLLIGDHNSLLPTLDSTRLLARAALRRAVAPLPSPPAATG
ncbi:MAG TPA: amino acid racemase [Steroidobacteraceae bacterium]|nr:amino acid racemase [Steroidobacteraceae bacterium]